MVRVAYSARLILTVIDGPERALVPRTGLSLPRGVVGCRKILEESVSTPTSRPRSGSPRTYATATDVLGCLLFWVFVIIARALSRPPTDPKLVSFSTLAKTDRVDGRPLDGGSVDLVPAYKSTIGRSEVGRVCFSARGVPRLRRDRRESRGAGRKGVFRWLLKVEDRGSWKSLQGSGALFEVMIERMYR